MSPTVGINELKVGMFVHLDLGWWAHPFARSSFLITAPDQIDIIRGLGLGRVRWSPEKSQMEGEGGGLLGDGITPKSSPLSDAPKPAGPAGAAGLRAADPATEAAGLSAPASGLARPQVAGVAALVATAGQQQASHGDAAAAPGGPLPPPARVRRAALSAPEAGAAVNGLLADDHPLRSDETAVGTRWAGAHPFEAAGATDAGAPAGQAAGSAAGPAPTAVAAAKASPAVPPGGQAAPPLDPHAARVLAHRQALAAQRLAERDCLEQLSQARDRCQQLHQQLREAPRAAGEMAEGLSRELVDRLLSTPDACMRTLADISGEPLVAHAMNVMVISVLVGRVCGLDAQPLVHLGQGALLHDIGKLALPHEHRHGELARDAEAAQAYRSHVALGMAQGERMGLPQPVLQVLAQHHEMVDGSGFPTGCGRDAMAQAARIVALVNRYDNLCNPPELAKGITPHEALATLFAQSRSRFDAVVLNAFIRMMGVYPPGSMVQLTDDRFASVIKVNASRPLKPRVLVCDLGVPAEDALLLDLDAEPQLGIRRSLRPAQLPPEVHSYLSPLPRMVYFFESASPSAESRAEAMAA